MKKVVASRTRFNAAAAHIQQNRGITDITKSLMRHLTAPKHQPPCAMDSNPYMLGWGLLPAIVSAKFKSILFCMSQAVNLAPPLLL